jgi:hypothetical protein
MTFTTFAVARSVEGSALGCQVGIQTLACRTVDDTLRNVITKAGASSFC